MIEILFVLADMVAGIIGGDPGPVPDPCVPNGGGKGGQPIPCPYNG